MSKRLINLSELQSTRRHRRGSLKLPITKTLQLVLAAIRGDRPESTIDLEASYCTGFRMTGPARTLAHAPGAFVGKLSEKKPEGHEARGWHTLYGN
jgi:hypothetical protein